MTGAGLQFQGQLRLLGACMPGGRGAQPDFCALLDRAAPEGVQFALAGDMTGPSVDIITKF